MGGVDGRFGDESRDKALRKDVQAVDKQGWGLVLCAGDFVRRECKELANVHTGLRVARSHLKHPIELFRLVGLMSVINPYRA